MLRYALANLPRLDLGRRHLGQTVSIPAGYEVVQAATKYGDLKPGDLLLRRSPANTEVLIEVLSLEAAQKIDDSVGTNGYIYSHVIAPPSRIDKNNVDEYPKDWVFSQNNTPGRTTTVYRSSTSPASLGSIPWVPIGIGLAALTGISIWYFSRK